MSEVLSLWVPEDSWSLLKIMQESRLRGQALQVKQLLGVPVSHIREAGTDPAAASDLASCLFVHWRAVHGGSGTGRYRLPPARKSQVECLAPSFNLAQPWLLLAFGKN